MIVYDWYFDIKNIINYSDFEAFIESFFIQSKNLNSNNLSLSRGKSKLTLSYMDQEETEYNSIHIILQILRKEEDTLSKIGIKVDSNVFLLITKEYEVMCNYEFNPATLLELGSLGIGLGFSAYEKQ